MCYHDYTHPTYTWKHEQGGKNIYRNEIACNLWQKRKERTRLWCKAIPYTGINKIGDNEFNIANYLHLGLDNNLAYLKHINRLQGWRLEPLTSMLGDEVF